MVGIPSMALRRVRVETYDEYVERLKTNELAARVKRADIA